MRWKWILSAGAAGGLVLGLTGYGTGTGAPLLSSSRATVVPPAAFVGTAGADKLLGTAANENLAGMAGPDLIRGGRGNDVLRGGPGNDRLFGGFGRDVIFGEQGDDRLTARDGEVDRVYGGPGFDRAWVDRNDIVLGVERINRR